MQTIDRTNGQDNSNNHRKIFDLVPAQDPMTSAILQARRSCVTDPDLSDGAKLLFVLLLDWSLWPGKNKGPGVITISTTKLTELLCRSARAVWGWKKELLEKRFVWITDHFVPNFWPIHTYHITALCPPEEGGDPVTTDGLWGNHVRRSQANRGVGARVQKGASVADSAVEKKRDSRFCSGNATGNSKKGNLSTAESAVGNRRTCGGAPQNLRWSTAESAVENRRTCGGAPQQTTPGNRKKQHSLRETLGRDLSVSEVGGSPPPQEKAFQSWVKSLDGQFPSHLRALEKKIRSRLENTKSDAARAGLRRQLKAVQDRLLPPVPDEPKKSRRREKHRSRSRN